MKRHFDSIEEFFDKASYAQKAIASSKFKHMTRSHLEQFLVHFETNLFNDATLSSRAIKELWQHYTGNVISERCFGCGFIGAMSSFVFRNSKPICQVCSADNSYKNKQLEFLPGLKAMLRNGEEHKIYSVSVSFDHYEHRDKVKVYFGGGFDQTYYVDGKVVGYAVHPQDIKYIITEKPDALKPSLVYSLNTYRFDVDAQAEILGASCYAAERLGISDSFKGVASSEGTWRAFFSPAVEYSLEEEFCNLVNEALEQYS